MITQCLRIGIQEDISFLTHWRLLTALASALCTLCASFRVTRHYHHHNLMIIILFIISTEIESLVESLFLEEEEEWKKESIDLGDIFWGWHRTFPVVSFSFDQSRVKLTLSYCCYGTGISKRHYIYYIGPDRVFFGRFGDISELTDHCWVSGGSKLLFWGLKRAFWAPCRCQKGIREGQIAWNQRG